MPQVVYDMTLDVSVSDPGIQIIAKQGDRQSRLLCIRLTDCKKPLPIEGDAAVLLNVATDEGAYAFDGIVCDGAAQFTLPAFATEKAGVAHCDVSVFGSEGGRLTSNSFDIVVEAAVCPGNGLTMGEGADVAIKLLGESLVHELSAVNTGEGYAVYPEVNHKYSLDLSDDIYRPNGVWAPFSLHLETPSVPNMEHWVVLYCHAPVSETAGAISIDWGDAAACLFADGEIPYITAGDFDVICTYSPGAGKWQIGVVQYAMGGETV